MTRAVAAAEAGPDAGAGTAAARRGSHSCCAAWDAGLVEPGGVCRADLAARATALDAMAACASRLRGSGASTDMWGTGVAVRAALPPLPALCAEGVRRPAAVVVEEAV